MKAQVIAVAALLAVALAFPMPALAHSRGGAIVGTALGGTALGFVLGSVISRPAQTAQPQVVFVQQPPGTTTTNTKVQQYMELDLVRERARNAALEKEILLLRAKSK